MRKRIKMTLWVEGRNEFRFEETIDTADEAPDILRRWADFLLEFNTADKADWL